MRPYLTNHDSVKWAGEKCKHTCKFDQKMNENLVTLNLPVLPSTLFHDLKRFPQNGNLVIVQQKKKEKEKKCGEERKQNAFWTYSNFGIGNLASRTKVVLEL